MKEEDTNMEIKRPAIAGTLESSDCQVMVEAGEGKIDLSLDSAVINQKDAARFSLFHALRSIDYRGCERVVRINGLDSPYWKEDIRCSVVGVQCFDTVYTDLDNMEGFRQDVETIHLMGFDGKSIINPRQINIGVIKL